MIEPIGQHASVSRSTNLKPVEVPHFAGAKKLPAKKSADSFKKSVKSAKVKKEAQNTAQAVKTGAKKGAAVLVDVTKKSVKFVVDFTKSFVEDVKGIAKAKGTKAISSVSDIVS